MGRAGLWPRLFDRNSNGSQPECDGRLDVVFLRVANHHALNGRAAGGRNGGLEHCVVRLAESNLERGDYGINQVRDAEIFEVALILKGSADFHVAYDHAAKFARLQGSLRVTGRCS